MNRPMLVENLLFFYDDLFAQRGRLRAELAVARRLPASNRCSPSTLETGADGFADFQPGEAGEQAQADPGYEQQRERRAGITEPARHQLPDGSTQHAAGRQ